MRLNGTIVRRRSLGKNLAFADIKRDDGRYNDGCECNSIDEEIPEGGDNIMSNEVIIKVAFRRSSPSWDSNTASSDAGTPFPKKTSSLPYGARVSMELLRRKDREESGRSSWDVQSWMIVGVHPKEVATVAATKKSGGVSCSAYLKVRGDAFLEFNVHPVTTTKTLDGKVSDDSFPVPTTIKEEQESEKNHNRTNDGTIGASDLSSSAAVHKNNTKNTEKYNSHGDKKAKALRAKVFASWLIDKFGADYLRGGDDYNSNEGNKNNNVRRDDICSACCESNSIGVLDVAGGKGQLSIELSTMERIPCTIIDPLLRRRVQGKYLKRLHRANGPVPQHIAARFESTTDGFLKTSIHDGDDLIRRATCLVGLHPDECTEDILDAALRYKKSVAIMPCCVFPTLFPGRRLRLDVNDDWNWDRDNDIINNRGSKEVHTYDEFVEFLLQKDPRLVCETLPFEGKNRVIYMKVPAIINSIGDKSVAKLHTIV